MAASLQINEIRFGVLAEALRQEIQTGPTDATKGIRVRHGIYSLREKAGQYIIRIRIPSGVLTAEQLETVGADRAIGLGGGRAFDHTAGN